MIQDVFLINQAIWLAYLVEFLQHPVVLSYAVSTKE